MQIPRLGLLVALRWARGLLGVGADTLQLHLERKACQ
jgi:hypothetical protein